MTVVVWLQYMIGFRGARIFVRLRLFASAQKSDFWIFENLIIQCFAKQSYLFFYLFSLIFSLETTIWEKREERKEKSEKNKKKRQSSFENCRFFLAEDEGFEPPQTESESGVLPLHKSSKCGTLVLYPIFLKCQAENRIISKRMEEGKDCGGIAGFVGVIPGSCLTFMGLGSYYELYIGRIL